ncbi:MAG: hypothetical protein IJJ22_00590 [Oscillospiraceae bacterium]|nr:hypothetical protein [Oscillospiraceae bacterium]
MALGTVAYAIGVSIHRLRQSELREQLQIDENQITDYVEYPVVEEAEKVPQEGVTLLSTMNDGEFQRIWVVINDMTPEMIAHLEFSEQVDWEGRELPANGHRYCFIYATMDGESYFDAMNPLHFRDSYDPDSQTLTTECAIPLLELKQGQAMVLRFVMAETIDYEMDHSEVELLCELGSVEVERTGQTLRTVWFPEPVSFENGAYGNGEFLGAELSASRVNWIIRHDGVSQMYRSHEFADDAELRNYQQLEQSWLAAIEEVERTAVLHFADGSSREVGLPLSSSQPEGDIVKDICPVSQGTININQVVSITINGKTFSFE